MHIQSLGGLPCRPTRNTDIPSLRVSTSFRDEFPSGIEIGPAVWRQLPGRRDFEPTGKLHTIHKQQHTKKKENTSTAPRRLSQSSGVREIRNLPRTGIPYQLAQHCSFDVTLPSQSTPLHSQLHSCQPCPPFPPSTFQKKKKKKAHTPSYTRLALPHSLWSYPRPSAPRVSTPALGDSTLLTHVETKQRH